MTDGTAEPSSATPDRHAPMYRGKAVGVGTSMAAFGLLLDQLTKSFAFRSVGEGGDIVATPFLGIIANLNPGAAFGIAGNAGPWLLIAVALALCAWLATMLLDARTTVHALALGAVIGGALGNVVDRLRLGAVRDFIDVHWHSWHWPAFNLADTFVVTGLFLLVLVSGGGSRGAQQQRAARPATKGTPDGR